MLRNGTTTTKISHKLEDVEEEEEHPLVEEAQPAKDVVEDKDAVTKHNVRLEQSPMMDTSTTRMMSILKSSQDSEAQLLLNNLEESVEFYSLPTNFDEIVALSAMPRNLVIHPLSSCCLTAAPTSTSSRIWTCYVTSMKYLLK